MGRFFLLKDPTDYGTTSQNEVELGKGFGILFANLVIWDTTWTFKKKSVVS